MTRNAFGVHLPNGPLDNDAVFDMGLGYYVMLHLQGELYAYRARQVSPDAVIEIRFYLPNWWAYEPGIWAEYCAEEYRKQRHYDGQPYTYASLGCHVTPANEQNLANEGGGSSAEWYTRINDWNLAWLREFRRLTACPLERIHWPAFAYGHSDDLPDNGYIGMEICREAIEAYGPLDLHPYWFQPGQVLDRFYGHRFELAHALFPAKTIFASEAGNFGVTRASAPDELVTWFQNLPAYVGGGALFIWEDPTGAHAVNNLSRNPAIAERLASETKAPWQPWPPVSPSKPKEDSMPELRDDFLRYASENPKIGIKAVGDMYQVTPEMVVQRVKAQGRKAVLIWTSGEGTTLYKLYQPSRKKV